MQFEMKVKGLMLDPSTQTPILILRDPEVESRILPVWIGIFEANAIAARIENIEPPRPMTHDLLKRVINAMDGVVTKVVISDLKDHTFFAVIFLLVNGREVQVDSRPSDAIAVALRSEAPIFVEDSVIEKAQALDATEERDEKLKKWLSDLGPEDLGSKYEM
ncbi:MAG: bifunctional nuclease family protein [Acidobacteriota bacterium]